MAKRTLNSLTLWDYSDRELLHVVNDARDDDGWAEGAEIATRLGLASDYPAANVGIRMGWMRRYGAIEKHPSEAKKWRLTAIGRTLMNGELTDEAEQMLAGLEPAELLMVTRHLTGRYQRTGRTAAHLIRREWVRGTRKPKS